MARVLLLAVVAAAWLAVCSGSPGLEARLDRVVQAYINTTINAINGLAPRSPVKPVGTKTRIASPDIQQSEEVRKDIMVGKAWPSYGYTMVGLKRSKHIQLLLEDVFQKGVPGDFLEAGVWRGGASIIAKAVMFAHGEDTRRVFVCDSFQGLPKNELHQDKAHNVDWSAMEYLRVSQEQVMSNFRDFDLLDDRVEFVKGYFSESMPRFRESHLGAGGAPSPQLAVVRADGDMYSSCFDIIVNLYDFIPVGGYFIIDDWTGFPCADAIKDFRGHLGINEEIILVDQSSAFFQKKREVTYNIPELYAKFYENKGPSPPPRLRNSVPMTSPTPSGSHQGRLNWWHQKGAREAA